MSMMTIAEAFAENKSPLSRRVLEYSAHMKRLVDKVKQPDFTDADWAPLTELVAVDEFERVGVFREVMNWDEYREFLIEWATTSGWDCSFRRITEVPERVYLELEERCFIGERVEVVNSISVYEFNEAGKLRHLDIYSQREL